MIPNIKFVFKFNSNPWKNPKDHYSIGPCPPSMRPTRLPALFSRAAPRLTALSRRSHPSVTNLTRSHLPVSPPSFPSSSSSVATFSLSRQLLGKEERRPGRLSHELSRIAGSTSLVSRRKTRPTISQLALRSGGSRARDIFRRHAMESK